MNHRSQTLVLLAFMVGACEAKDAGGDEPSPAPAASSGDATSGTSTETEVAETGEPDAPEEDSSEGEAEGEVEAATEPPPLDGEGPSGAAGREARRQAALDLLGDGESAAALSVVATDPGRGFNRNLADDMTPKVWVYDRPKQKSVNVKPGTLKVTGGLDREIVRRVVRHRLNELRACYTTGLNKNSKVEGSLTINFTIDASGKVPVSSVKQSKLKDASVEACFAKAHRRWKFPKPLDGEMVVVQYTYKLSK